MCTITCATNTCSSSTLQTLTRNTTCVNTTCASQDEKTLYLKKQNECNDKWMCTHDHAKWTPCECKTVTEELEQHDIGNMTFAKPSSSNTNDKHSVCIRTRATNYVATYMPNHYMCTQYVRESFSQSVAWISELNYLPTLDNGWQTHMMGPPTG